MSRDPGGDPAVPQPLVEALLAEGLQLLRAGRPAEAEARLRAALASAPHSVEALQLLGVAANAQGRAAEALACFDRALALDPRAVVALHNRAQAAFDLGRDAAARADLEEAVRLKPDLAAAWTLLGLVLARTGDAPAAERAYRRALALRPDHVETHYNLGLLLQEAGRIEEAIPLYRKALALRPGFAAAHNNLANALKLAGRPADALAHYEAAVRLAPELADALSNYGTALREAGRHEEAIAFLERAARLKPDSPAVLNNLGLALFGRNRFDEAERAYRRALAIDPTFHEARNNLGNALLGLGRSEEALECYAAVLESVPEHADAYSNMGLALQERGEDAAAIAAYERALALEPAHTDALNNLGYLLGEAGRLEEAMEHYRHALAADPANARAAYNLGLAHLTRFEFEAGWPLCELRYRTSPPVAVERPFRIPRFDAADWGRSRRLAVWREQGVGDQLLYATLVPELERRGLAFVLEVDRRLAPAFRRAHPQWPVVAPEESEAAFAGCDRHIAIASLPGLLRSSLESFAAQPRALLTADGERSHAFRERLARGRRVAGISWRSFQPAMRGFLQRKKSAPLAAFGALSRRPDLALLDLQYGDTLAEREAFAASGGRLERLEELDLFNDLEGVLAAIEACDLVVTTSNVTAHLAGVLGKETWLVYLAANPPFHYWSAAADGRCIWYPSVRIVTGRDLRTWEEALARIDARLAA